MFKSHFTADLFAVFFVQCAFHSLVATVAAIVTTAFIVVLVVANAVSPVLGEPASLLTKVVRVDALALSKAKNHSNTHAEKQDASSLNRLHGVTQSITLAESDVQYFEYIDTPKELACLKSHSTLQSFTTDLFTVFLLHHATFHRLVATVAAIVTTAFIVVLVVANTVSPVLGEPAPNRRIAKVVRVDALALTKKRAHENVYRVARAQVIMLSLDNTCAVSIMIRYTYNTQSDGEVTLDTSVLHNRPLCSISSPPRHLSPSCSNSHRHRNHSLYCCSRRRKRHHL